MLNRLTKGSGMVLRMYCSKPGKLDDLKWAVYFKSLGKSDKAHDFTQEDMINKGFATLSIKNDKGEKPFSWKSKEYFENAKKLDIHKKYSQEIECGLEQASGVLPECYHAVTPQKPQPLKAVEEADWERRRNSMTETLKEAKKGFKTFSAY